MKRISIVQPRLNEVELRIPIDHEALQFVGIKYPPGLDLAPLIDWVTVTYHVATNGGAVRQSGPLPPGADRPQVCECLKLTGRTLQADPDTLLLTIRDEYHRAKRAYRAGRERREDT